MVILFCNVNANHSPKREWSYEEEFKMKKSIIYVNHGVVSLIDEATANILRQMGVKTLAIHAGEFHADDLSASAIFALKFKEVLIYRVFSISETDDYDYIVDIGMSYDEVKFFDHHQKIEEYADGVKPCGATLFAEAMLDTELYKALYERVLRPIAVQDNGQKELLSTYPNLMFGWVGAMNPVWNNSEQNSDEQFAKALEMAIPMIEQVIAQIKAEKEAQEIVASARKEANGRILVLPQYAPWHNWVVEQDAVALFVVHPSNRGGFMVQCVPPSLEDGFSQRRPLPSAWLENRPQGCTFVHRGLFCAAFESESSAVEALLQLF